MENTKEGSKVRELFGTSRVIESSSEKKVTTLVRMAWEGSYVLDAVTTEAIDKAFWAFVDTVEDLF